MRISDLRDWLRAMREAHEEWREERSIGPFGSGETFNMDELIDAQRVRNAEFAKIIEYSHRNG